MKTNILTLVITLTLGVILAGSLLMPVVTSAIEDNQTTVVNNVGGKWHMVQVDEVATASWDGTTCLVNDSEITFGSTYSFITADTFCCRWTSSSRTATIFNFGFDEDGTTPLANTAYSTWTMTAQNGVATFTNLADETQTTTVEYNWLFVPTPTASAPSEWAMTAGTSTYWVTDKTPIYISSTDGRIVIEGTIDDLKVTSNGEPAEFVVNAEEISGYEEKVWKVTSIVVTAYSGTEYTFNRMVFPYSIVLTNEGAAAYVSLYAVIPIMVILGLVVSAVGAIVVKRND